MKFAAITWIFYNFQIQKRIVSAEPIRGNMVYYSPSYRQRFWKIIYLKVFWVFFFRLSFIILVIPKVFRWMNRCRCWSLAFFWQFWRFFWKFWWIWLGLFRFLPPTSTTTRFFCWQGRWRTGTFWFSSWWLATMMIFLSPWITKNIWEKIGSVSQRETDNNFDSKVLPFWWTDPET